MSPEAKSEPLQGKPGLPEPGPLNWLQRALFQKPAFYNSNVRLIEDQVITVSLSFLYANVTTDDVVPCQVTRCNLPSG